MSAIFSTLTAFLAAAARPRTPLAKAVVLVLIVKLIGMAGMKIFMFSEGAGSAIDAASMAHVMGLPSLP